MALQIKNVTGAHGQNTLDQTADRLVLDVLADAAVAVGDVVAWTAQTTDDVPTVHPADSDNDDPASVAGVAIRCQGTRPAMR